MTLLYFYGTFLYCKMEKQAKIRENIFPSEHKSYFSPVFFFLNIWAAIEDNIMIFKCIWQFSEAI